MIVLTLSKVEAPLTPNDRYVESVAQIIAAAQITNGGPVILLQPENEYSLAERGILFPDPVYFSTVEEQYRHAGIVVPFINNDAYPGGHFAPGTGIGAVDVYGHDVRWFLDPPMIRCGFSLVTL